MYVCIYVYISISIYIYLSISISIDLYRSIYIHTCIDRTCDRTLRLDSISAGSSGSPAGARVTRDSHTHIDRSIYIYIYRSIYISIHIYIHIYIYTYIHMYTYTHIYIHTHTEMYIHLHTHICVCMYICIYEEEVNPRGTPSAWTPSPLARREAQRARE